LCQLRSNHNFNDKQRQNNMYNIARPLQKNPSSSVMGGVCRAWSIFTVTF
jgi:hypothetical protein